MPDREKVKKGLDICTSKEPCNGCPYLKERNCSLAMVDDALALLQEQEAVVKQWTKEIAENQLVTVFKDGKMIIEQSLSQIRNLLHNGKFQEMN